MVSERRYTVQGMSENAKQALREKLSGIPDVQVLSKRDAEKLLTDAAGALGKVGLRGQAKEIAEGFPDAGLDTYGDLRSADVQFFQEDCKMKKFDAMALVKLLAESPHAVEGSSNNETTTDPTALQGQSEAQSGQALSVAQTMASELASALVRGQEESARALLEAAKRAHRGPLPALELQGGSKPSVKVTEVWLEKVKTVLKDYDGLEKLVVGMLKDPRGSSKEAAQQGVADPMGIAYDHVRASIHDVYDDMGGGEEDNVGVLLHNIWQAAIGKEKEAAAKDFTAFMGLGTVKAGDPAGLLAGHKSWEEALLEVRYGSWCDEDYILDSAEERFQRFGPQLNKAKREAAAGGTFECDRFLKSLKQQVHRAAEAMQASSTKAAAVEDTKLGKARQQEVEKAKKQKAAAKARGAAARAQEGAPEGALEIPKPRSRRPCELWTTTGDCRFGSRCRFSHVGPMEVNANLQQQSKDQAAEARVVAAATALVKQQIYEEAGLGRQGAKGLGGVLTNPKHNGPNPKGDPKHNPKHDPSPSHRCRSWSSVVGTLQQHNSSPKVYPKPNPPRVGAGRGTGFLRVLQENSERHRRGRVQQGGRMPLPVPKPQPKPHPQHVVMATEVEEIVGRWSLEGGDLECNTNTLVPRAQVMPSKPNPMSRVRSAARGRVRSGPVTNPSPGPSPTLPQCIAPGIKGPVVPDPDPSPRTKCVRFAEGLGEWAKAKGHAKAIVMRVQGRVARRARIAHKVGKWALEGKAGVSDDTSETNPIHKAKGTAAPSYLQDIQKDKAKAQASLADKGTGMTEGPLADTAAEIGVIRKRDVKFMTSKHKLDVPIHLRGIGGAQATEGGELSVGNHTMTGVIVDDAPSSVFPLHDALYDGGVYVQDKDSATLYKHGKATHMVPRGKLFAFPCGKKQGCQDLEAHEGAVKALRAHEDHARRMALRHWRRGHMPKAPHALCEECAEGKYRKGDGVKGPEAPHRDLEVGFDLIGPLVESNDGNTYKLVGGCATTGVGCSRGIPDKKSATIMPHVISMLSEMRQHHNHPDTVTMRFHTDVDKSFDGILGRYALDNAWLRTTTEGYDSNGNAIVERRNEKLNQGLRTLLLQATGGRLYYEELWDVAMDHIHDLINHAPEAGGTSPVEKAGGDPIQVDDMEVFGCLVYYYEAPERRSAPKQTDPSGRKGIWVGRSNTLAGGGVSGGHKIVPLEYGKGVWELGPTIVRSYVTPVSSKYPLRTAAGKGADPKKYEAFVERCSANAEEADVYVVDKVLDVRVVSGDVEYKVKWRGYTSKQSTWEPAANLLSFGAEEIVKEFHSANRDKINPLRLAYMVMNLELMTEDDKAVAHLMKRHKLGGTLADWKPGYVSELESVISRRCTEVFGDEYNRVLKHEKVVPLRMNPEAKYEGGILQRLKMRLIVKGFLEPKEWDSKTDSPTAMTSTVRQLVAMGVAPTMQGMTDIEDDVISVGDISTAFLLGDEYKEGEVDRYVSYKAYPTAHKRVFKLKGSLYGQRDAPHRWWSTLTSWLKSEGWVPSKNDPSMYHYPSKPKGARHEPMAGMTMCTHVDDILTRGSRLATQYFWDRVAARFPVKHWEIVEYDNPVTYCAKRISKIRRDGKVWYTVDQTRDIEVFLAEAGMTAVRATSAPMPYKHDIVSDTTPLSDQEHKQYRSWVGSLSYFLHTRYDIAYEVGRLAQYLAAPTKGAMKALRRVMAYLATVPDKCLEVPRVVGDTWHVYSDSDHAGDKVMGTNKSHTGVMIMLNGMPVFWRSNKQPKTSLSSAQAEIYALSEACKDANKVTWIHEEMGRNCSRPLRVYVDNAAGISFQQSTCASSKLGGIFDNRWDWVEELKAVSQFEAVKIATDKNVADLFTKCLVEPVRARLFKQIEQVAYDCASR